MDPVVSILPESPTYTWDSIPVSMLCSTDSKFSYAKSLKPCLSVFDCAANNLRIEASNGVSSPLASAMETSRNLLSSPKVTPGKVRFTQPSFDTLRKDPPIDIPC